MNSGGGIPPWRDRLSKARRRVPHPKALISLALAVAGGWAARSLDIPLAWILGPLVATAAAGISGLPIFSPLAGRRFGQVTIGTSIGLNVTAGVLMTIVLWLPLMAATAWIAMLLAAIASVPFSRASRIDGRTAYYALMPGGLSEMANIGAASGAQPEPIALVQALRVALLVLVLPPLIVSLDIHGAASENLPGQVLTPGKTVLALLVGAVGVWLARSSRLNNPWMIGAVVGTGAAAASGMLSGQIPVWLFYFGQFMIGLSIGARFKRESLVRLPRVALAGSLFILVVAACLFGYAFVVSRATGLDLASTALSASPGGFAEMAVTAQTLHLSVGLVTAFHVVRAFFVNGFAEHLRIALERAGMFTAIERQLVRFRGPNP